MRIIFFYLAGCLQSLVRVVNDLACFPTAPERAVNPLCLGTVLWAEDCAALDPALADSDHLIFLSCRKLSRNRTQQLKESTMSPHILSQPIWRYKPA